MIEASQPCSKPKRTVYRATNEKCIRSIWDWSDKKQKYTQRTTGNKFQVNLERGGKTISASFTSLSEAIRWRDITKLQIEKTPIIERVIFKTLLERFFKHHSMHVSDTTIKTYRDQTIHLDFLNDLLVEDITFKTIDQWIARVTSTEYRSSEKVKSTRFSYIKELKMLNLVFNHYRNYINGSYINPILPRHKTDVVFDRETFQKRKLASTEKYMTSQQMDHVLNTILEQANESPEKQLYYVAMLIQLRTGMRVGEVFALRWEDIDWKDGVYRITKTALWRGRTIDRQIGNAPKNRKNRTVVFIHEVIQQLKQLQQAQSRISGLIFSETGERVKGFSSILHHYNSALKKAGIPFTGTHITRHSFATDFWAQMPNEHGALQSILGHSSPKQTSHYAKALAQTNIVAMNKYGLLKAKSKIPENA